MVRSGLVLNGMVHGYCLYVVPCKNSSSWFENNRVMDDLRIFGLVWFGMVRSGLVWFQKVWCMGIVYM